MRTTLDIDEKLVEDAVRLTGEKSKSKAVSKAVEGYLYWKAVEGLQALAGKVEFDGNLERLDQEQKAHDLRRLERATVK